MRDYVKWVLLGIYLIIHGLILLGIDLAGLPLGLVAGLCAIIAGILFVINR